jgi:RNA polymerase sigma-70 factor (ECF subfamily)
MVPEPTAQPTTGDPDLPAVQAAQGGDGAAFDLLVRRHERRVFRLALRLLGDADAAEDAAQEAFVKAWRALPRFEAAARFSTWLTRIAINQCRNDLRRRRTRKHGSLLSLDEAVPGTDLLRASLVPDRAASPEDSLRGDEVRRAFETALSEIDAEDREVLLLREVEDLPYEGIAEILDVAVGTVRSRLHRARASLRKRMSPVLDR